MGTLVSFNRVKMARVVQYYLQRPLLLRGRKFDVRAYMLIAWTSPFLVYFHHGYVRLSLVDYDLANLDNTAAHLTNQYQQKKEKDFDQRREESMWSMEALADYLATEEGRMAVAEDARHMLMPSGEHKDCADAAKHWVFTTFAARMKSIMTYAFQAAKPHLDRSVGYFDLLGVDFMVDEHLNTWLIEVNVNPALHTRCRPCQDLLPGMVRSVLDIELDLFQQHTSASRRPICAPSQEVTGAFELIHSEKSRR